MAKSKLEIEMTGKDAKAAAMLRRSEALVKKLEGRLGKTGSAARAAAQEQKKLGQAAKRVYDSTRTPQERHNQKLKELKRLLAAGAINQDTYGRAARRSGNEMKEAGRKGKQAFGFGALGQVKSMITGFIGVGAAVAGVTTALHEMNAARAEAAEQERSSRMGIGSLAQVATSSKDYLHLRKKAEELYATGGAESLDAAARTVFSLRSAGAMGQFNLFKNLRASGMVESPDVMARSARTLIAAMGKEETGDMRAMVSKSLAASAISPSSAEKILEASARSGGSARALGISDEAVLTATGMMSKVTGTAELGGTAVASLLRSLDKKGDKFKGKSLKESLLEIQAMNMGGAELQEYFGRAEAVRAYRGILGNMAEYDKTLKSVHQAQATDRVGRQMQYHKADPALVAGQMADKARAKEELSRKPLGTARNLSDARMAATKVEQRQQGYNEWFITFGNWADHIERFVRGDEALLRKNLTKSYMPDEWRREAMTVTGTKPSGGVQVGAGSSVETQKQTGLLTEIRDELKKQHGNTGGMPPNAAPTLSKPDEDR